VTGQQDRDGRVVPVFAVTGGRTRTGPIDLPLESLVTATDHLPEELAPEYRTIVRLARRPVSIIEIAAGAGVPVGVARVLVGDLAAAGHVVVHAPPPRSAPSPQILNRLLEGLEWSLNSYR
jgi:Protein of unknown function (DUF742)